jgi:hypothetical protein
MTTAPVSGLPDLLSQALSGSPYAPSSTLPETFLIDHLVESVMDFEVGEITFDQLREQFYAQRLGNFDFDSWFAQWVDEGTYAYPEQET